MTDTTTTIPTTAAASPVRDPRTTPTAATIADLAARLCGRLVTPADDDWDTARQAWNLAIDQRPDFVVEAADAGDVAATVGFARAAGLRVATQATGHGAAVRGDLAGAILLRTDRMRGVTVDVAARTVRADAGAWWQDVTEALAPHGLVGLAGSSGDVGVVGYLLGGGCSWLAREHGLGCSSVTAVELVTGDGRQLRVDAAHEPELFWAMRGGAGNAAVVTAVEFTAYPAALVYAGSLMFPIERAREVFTAYERWTRGLAETATTAVRLLRIPPLPDIPEPMRGRAFVAVTGCIDLPAEQAAALLAPLRELGPEVDMFGPMPGSALGHINMDPPQPSPARADGLMLTDMTPETVEALFAVVGPDAHSPLLAVDFRHIGGALGRPDPDGGAVDHLPGRFLMFAVGITPVPQAEAPVLAALASLAQALRRWTASRNFANFSESPLPASSFYDDATLDRLREVRRRYDPDRVIRAGHQWAA